MARDVGDGRAQIGDPGSGRDAMLGEMAAELARAGAPRKQTDEMAREGMQPPAGFQMGGEMRLERLQHGEGVGHRRDLAEEKRIDPEQDLRVLVGLAADHDAVEMRQMTSPFIGRANAAIDGNGQMRMGGL